MYLILFILSIANFLLKNDYFDIIIFVRGDFMIFEKQIIKTYKRIAFNRVDDKGTAFYFSYLDFPGLKAESFSFKSIHGHTLKGNFYFYENYNPERLIIFDHGFGGGHRSYMKEIEKLCSFGFKVLAYDHTGCMESEGLTTNGMTTSLVDLNDCLKTLKEDEHFKSLDFSVIGHSWGGYSTLNISKLHPDISHIVVLSGFISVKRLIKAFFGGLLKPYRKAIYKLEKNTNPDFVDFDAIETLNNSKVKTLLIYSNNDMMCKKKDTYDVLYKSLSYKNNIQFILLDNKGHNPNYTTEAVNYLNEYSKNKKKMKKQKLLETPDQKQKFVASFDWDKMTKQDEEVWQNIQNWLNN